MIGLLLRGFFLVGIISWYSAGVWKFIDEYFRNEYKTYLSREFKRNKHLQLGLLPDSEIQVEMPASAVKDDPKELSPKSSLVEPTTTTNADEMKTCEGEDLCRSQEKTELDYDNQLTTNDRQSLGDDDVLINHWHKRKSTDNSDNNLHCQLEATTCEDN